MAYAFTSYASVRALLGVSAKELPNDILADPLFSDSLGLELAPYLAEYEGSVDATFTATFDVLAVYAMASYALPGLPGYAPKSITDGKAGFARDGNSPYKDTAARVTEGLAMYRRLLAEAFGSTLGTPLTAQTPPSYLAVSSLDIDPVTGE